MKHERRNFKFSTKNTSHPETNNEHSGEGISDVISSVGNIVGKTSDFISKNKDLINSGAKAVSSVSSAANTIADTVKKSKQLKELQMIQELHNKRLEAEAKAAKPSDLSQSVKNKIRESEEFKGSGFASGSGFKIIE